MKNIDNLSGGAAADPIETAIAHLQTNGLAAVDHVASLVAPGGVITDDRAQIVAIELLTILLAGFDTDDDVAATYAAIARLPAELARLASNTLLLANFGEENGNLAELDDASALCLFGLIAAAGHKDDALSLVREAVGQRHAPAFRRAAYVARAAALGLDGALATLWLTPADDVADIAQAQAAVEARPLDPATHRALGRRLAEAGRTADALAAFAVGLALPIGAGDKLDLGEDLAVYAAWLDVRGESEPLNTRRVRLALGACLPAAAHAEKIVARLEKSPAHRVFDESVFPRVVTYFRQVAWHADQVGASAYPTRDGRPHIDVVWLEITNHCNQKCTFCPDMFREDPRTWLPLDQIKRTIDELAETFSVGSMQLNAYGEPLVHPNIKEILSYIREKRLPWPTFFTSHGLTLVDKKLQQLSHNYPRGIAISLHNDSQESYDATRSAKIGDYDTLVARVSALLRQMVNEGAACNLRLYQMVSNGMEDMQVDSKVRGAFPNTPERMIAHVRKWEAIAAGIAAAAPAGVDAQAVRNSEKRIVRAFTQASNGDGMHIDVLRWKDVRGNYQTAFMSPRPVTSYANLLLEYHPDWEVERKVVNTRTCDYFTASPSLAIFATGKLGICCMDMNSTATFGSLSDYGSLKEALLSPEARRMFAQLSNGVATSRGCQICLGTGKQLCADKPNPAA